MAVVLPLLVLLMGIAFTGWSAMQSSIRLTTAARAGAIKAANDLQAGKQASTAWNDATTAVNLEEGVSNIYQNTNSHADDYVNMSETTDTLNGTGVTIKVVQITISQSIVAVIPVVSSLSVNTDATARYG